MSTTSTGYITRYQKNNNTWQNGPHWGQGGTPTQIGASGANNVSLTEGRTHLKIYLNPSSHYSTVHSRILQNLQTFRGLEGHLKLTIIIKFRHQPMSTKGHQFTQITSTVSAVHLKAKKKKAIQSPSWTKATQCDLGPDQVARGQPINH